MPRGFPNFMVSSSICWANSRVGAKITAYGPWSESSILQHKQKVQSWELSMNVKQTNVIFWLFEPGFWYLSILGRVVIQTSSGIRKAAVLPLPVSATPMMSRFCKPIGMACLWMGVGSWNFKHQYYKTTNLTEVGETKKKTGRPKGKQLTL